MGGIGSGNRWRHGAKDAVEDYRRLDVRGLARAGALVPGYRGGWYWTCHGEVIASIRMQVEEGRLVLDYCHREPGRDWKDENYPVRLSWTACHLGGQRPWFICPVKGCGQRVAILYGGTIFACRRCHSLVYASTRENAGDRATRRAERIRERLGWEPGILNGDGGKPKGMHWRTYERLRVEHDTAIAESLAELTQRLGLILRLP
jgi:hypothetical protein